MKQCNKDGDEGEGMKKKNKANAITAFSSSSSSIPTNTTQPTGLASQHHHHFLQLHSLSDIAHDAIASYLTNNCMHCMMECDQWLLKAYGGRIERLTMPSIRGKEPSTLATTMLSLLGRRSGLSHVTSSMDDRVKVLIETMRRGYLNNLRGLKLKGVWCEKQKVVSIAALYSALADGLCPKINSLDLYFLFEGDDEQPVPSLSDAMRSRMEEGKGCCGLKSLQIHGSYGYTNILSILSSGACEALEELNMRDVPLSDEDATHLSEWLSRTKAPNLKLLKLNLVPPSVVAALCSPGVAPRLQTINLAVKDATSISHLTQANERRAWRNLADIDIGLLEATSDAENESMKQAAPDLLQAIGHGAPKLKVLSLCYSDHLSGPECGVAFGRMLGDGGCSQLEELDRTDSIVNDGAMVELARALERGAPCNTTLRRLNLSFNDIGGAGVGALAGAMEGGALPYLEYLDLHSNEDIKDHGVVALAMAMTTRRVLSCLRVLKMENVGMTETGAWALFDAFCYHKPCSHLQSLRISHNPEVGDGGVVRLAKAIEAGALQHLENLDLEEVGMTGEGFRALVKAMVTQPNPGCPRLEVFNVESNDIGDEGVVYLADAIKVKGIMQQLAQLQLRNNGINRVGAIALLTALTQSHVCPNLHSMNLGPPYEESDDDDSDDGGHGRSYNPEVDSLRVALM